MENLKSLVDVAVIVREFVKNEARTLAQSQGKMLRDERSDERQLRNAG